MAYDHPSEPFSVKNWFDFSDFSDFPQVPISDRSLHNKMHRVHRDISVYIYLEGLDEGRKGNFCLNYTTWV